MRYPNVSPDASPGKSSPSADVRESFPAQKYGVAKEAGPK